MLDRRSFLVGAFSSAWVVGASAFAAEEGAVDKKDRIPFAPSADDALVSARYDDPLVAGQPDGLF